MLSYISLVVFLIGLPGPGGAPKNDNIPVTPMVLYPAKSSTPALKYPLLPAARDLRAGNAALLYQRGHAPESWGEYSKKLANITELLEVPLAKMSRGDWDAKSLAALKDVDLAARRTYCDWDLLDRLRQEGFEMTVPDIS